jgi:hypothetical protein
MDVNNKAFIFTMDAILAIIPVFIVLASVSSVSYSSNLFGQSFIIGGERISNDVLKTLDLKGELNETNTTIVNETFSFLIPQEYNFRNRLIFNETIIVNVSRADIANASDIVTARRITNVHFFSILGSMLGISHFGSEITLPCCNGSGAGIGARKEYTTNFTATDIADYTYWLVSVLEEGDIGGGAAPYSMAIEPFEGGGYSQCACSGAPPPVQINENPPSTVEITPYVSEGENSIYVFVRGNAVVSFWIIQAPLDAPISEITPENALLATWAVSKLEVWPK